jgi:hypothetical protein
MEFAFTAEEQAFREDIRQFLRTIPRNILPMRVWTLAMALEPIRMPLCANWEPVVGCQCAGRGSMAGRSARLCTNSSCSKNWPLQERHLGRLGGWIRSRRRSSAMARSA